MLCTSFFKPRGKKSAPMDLLYFLLSYKIEAAQKAKNKPCFVDILLLLHPRALLNTNSSPVVQD